MSNVYNLDLLEDDLVTWRPVYVGETGLEEEGRGTDVRDGEHVHLYGGAPRVAASVAKHGAARHRIRLVDKVATKAEGKALETYLMVKLETIVPAYSKLKEKFAYENREFDYHQPDVSLHGQPTVFQLNCKRSTKNQDDIDAAGKAFEDRQSSTTLAVYSKEEQDRVFAAIDAQLGLETPLSHMLVTCAKPEEDDEFERIVFEIDSPYMRANQLRIEYEQRDAWAVVDGTELFIAVKSIRDLVCTEGDTTAPVSRKDLDSRLKTLYLASHPDKSKGMPASAVVGLFTMIESLAGEVEEKELRAKAAVDDELKQRVDEADRWREWIQFNDGVKPSQVPKAANKTVDDKVEEKQVAISMRDWRKGRHGVPKQRARNVYLVVLRDFAIFADFCLGKDQKGRDVAKNINALLKRGFGMRKEQEVYPHLQIFPSMCATCQRHTPESHMWNDYLNGRNDARAPALLANLPPERVATAKAMHDAAAPAQKAKLAESHRRQTEQLHASGVRQPRAIKKARVE